MSRCVGLTGGIASGKSTVGARFLALGVPLIDADQVARDVVQPDSEGLARVLARFGDAYRDPDGGLDRRRLRQTVFADPAARRDLEAILHPLIRAELAAWRSAQTAPYCIIMVPIMAEGGFTELCERILVVDVPRETQLTRLMARDSIDGELAQQMLAAQSDRANRLALADEVIDNSGPAAALDAAVQALHESYLQWAQPEA